MSVRQGAVFGPSDHLQCEDERLVLYHPASIGIDLPRDRNLDELILEAEMDGGVCWLDRRAGQLSFDVEAWE